MEWALQKNKTRQGLRNHAHVLLHHGRVARKIGTGRGTHSGRIVENGVWGRCVRSGPAARAESSIVGAAFLSLQPGGLRLAQGALEWPVLMQLVADEIMKALRRR